MKIGLISNWDMQCGNAEYARALNNELLKEFQVVLLPPDTSMARKEISLDKDIRVAIINWHGGRVKVQKEDVDWFKANDVKTILIHQNYVGGENLDGMEFDKLVVHEPIDERTPSIGRQTAYIPHGIPDVPLRGALGKSAMIGTAGFPFPWKRFDVVAEAAKKFNMKCLMIAPKSDQLNTDEFMSGIQGHIPELALIHREWLPVEEVVQMLSECVLNIFWFQSMDPSDELGQSGSVRMGLAARRPTIISTHRKLRTLFKYEDELYICHREEDVYKAVEEIRMAPHLAKRPDKVLKAQGWPVVGQTYRNVVTGLVG